MCPSRSRRPHPFSCPFHVMPHAVGGLLGNRRRGALHFFAARQRQHGGHRLVERQDEARRERPECPEPEEPGPAEHPEPDADALALLGDLRARQLDLLANERRGLLGQLLQQLGYGTVPGVSLSVRGRHRRTITHGGSPKTCERGPGHHRYGADVAGSTWTTLVAVSSSSSSG